MVEGLWARRNCLSEAHGKDRVVRTPPSAMLSLRLTDKLEQ